jgi:hypothetical protein
MRPIRPFLILLVVAAAVAGCFLTFDDFMGKGCRSDQDCPANYACLPMLADGGLTCSAIYPYQPDSGPPDSGPPGDAGGPDRTYFYCTDVAPILSQTCQSNCHLGQVGFDTSGCDTSLCVPSPGLFELDYYDAGTDGGIGGAYQERDRIKARAFDLQTMPPAGVGAVPSQQQRQILAWWDEQGGQYCDGGSSGGVSFALQIQTIFATDCVACHAPPTPTGGLDLTTGNSYANLVNVPCQCDAGPGVFRVKPGDTANSMIWRKTGNTSNMCGASMPKGQQPLSVMSAAQYQQLSDWITQGAPNN